LEGERTGGDGRLVSSVPDVPVQHRFEHIPWDTIDAKSIAMLRIIGASARVS